MIGVLKYELCYGNGQVVIRPLSWQIEYRSTQCLTMSGMHMSKNFLCGSATDGYCHILTKNLARPRGWFPWWWSYKSTSRRSGWWLTIWSWMALWRHLPLTQRCACKDSESGWSMWIRSCQGRLVRKWQRNDNLGKRKFCGYRSGTESKQNHHRRCLLV